MQYNIPDTVIAVWAIIKLHLTIFPDCEMGNKIKTIFGNKKDVKNSSLKCPC